MTAAPETAKAATPPGDSSPRNSGRQRGRRARVGRYCRVCGYDLAALDRSSTVCPECGGRFNPLDPKSTSRLPLDLVARRRRLRIGFALIVALMICAAWAYEFLPQPARAHGGRLWRWFGARFGLEEIRSLESVYSAWWWADRMTSAEGRRVVRAPNQPPVMAPGASWSLRKTAGGLYALSVAEPGVPWEPIVRSFNAMKPAMFGVRFIGADQALNHAAFEVRGDEPAILSAIVTHYGMELQPVLVRPDQDYIWIYDTLYRVMTTMDLSQAHTTGVEVAPFSRIQEEVRLLPRPRSQVSGGSSAHSAREGG